MVDPGELLATGRECDVFAHGPDRVLRRNRKGRSLDAEGAVMTHARAAGFPVPEVFESSGPDQVLERVDGWTMLEDLKRRPWNLSQHGATLAALHRRLHSVVAPPGLRTLGAGDRLLHLDLHPDNVMLTATGPVVIDWTNARAGDPAVDATLTWVILASAAGSAAIHVMGRLLARSFAAGLGSRPSGPALEQAIEFRLADANVAPAERAAIERLAAG